MARKSKEDAAQTRSRILAVALDEFGEKGFSRTTLDGIAGRAGFTRGAVYWHFKDKAEIFSSLATEMYTRSESLLGPLEDERCASVEAIARSFTEYLAFLEKDEIYRRFYALAYFNTEWADELSDVLHQIKSFQRELLTWTEQRLNSLQKDGKIVSSVNVRIVALALTALSEGLISCWLMDKEAFSLAEDGRHAIRQLLSGLDESVESI